MSRKRLIICFLLAVITLVAYWPVQHNDFINLDDNLYITDNLKVKSGLTLDGVIWAFGFNGKGYWQPLTWISHMMDIELFGLNPTGHHLTNLGIHLANALLLFWIFYRATGQLYRCAFMAALFALHPLNVDSVAWAAERKNLLSSFFGFLCLFLYLRYAERPSVKRYLLTLTTFVVGLMVKPMLVTLPCVLLLLDYWPLKRLKLDRWQKPALGKLIRAPISERQDNILQLIAEKLPFLAFSIVSIWVSILSTQQMGIVVAEDTVPMTMRIANALVSYLNYLVKMIWPFNLAIYYPFPKELPFWQIAGSTVFLVTVTILFILRSNYRPYLTTGWLWYLGTLVPVIGIIQAGEWPAMADRWAYIPMIGIFMIVVWGLSEITSKWRYKTPALFIVGVGALICCTIAVRVQLPHWKNSRVLFSHTLDITRENSLAHINLGSALLWDGEYTAALQQFKAALEIKPEMPMVHNNIGHALMKLGRIDEAVNRYFESLQINPEEAVTHNSLAVALIEQGRIAEAISHLQTAVRLEPGFADAYVNLGAVYRQQGQTKMAARYYLQAIRLRPDLPEAYNNLGILLLKDGRLKAAARYFHKALEQKSDFAAARDNLEKVRAAQREHEAMVAQIQNEIKRNPEDVNLFLTLGDLYKKQGELNDALENYHRAYLMRPNSLPVIKKMAIGHAMNGNYTRATELLHKMISLRPDDTEPYIYLAGIYARQNKLNEAVGWLKKAIAKGYHNWDRLKTDSNFDNIRGAPSFQELIPTDPVSAKR